MLRSATFSDRTAKTPVGPVDVLFPRASRGSNPADGEDRASSNRSSEDSDLDTGRPLLSTDAIRQRPTPDTFVEREPLLSAHAHVMPAAQPSTELILHPASVRRDRASAGAFGDALRSTMVCMSSFFQTLSNCYTELTSGRPETPEQSTDQAETDGTQTTWGAVYTNATTGAYNRLFERPAAEKNLRNCVEGLCASQDALRAFFAPDAEMRVSRATALRQIPHFYVGLLDDRLKRVIDLQCKSAKVGKALALFLQSALPEATNATDARAALRRLQLGHHPDRHPDLCYSLEHNPTRDQAKGRLLVDIMQTIMQMLNDPQWRSAIFPRDGV
jgi:hypothetical protein